MHLTSSSLSCILICLLFNDQVLAQEESVRPLHFYSPCTFPVSFSNNPIQNREHYRVCGKKRHLSFVCDLHFQLHQQNVFAITKAFEKHRVVLEQDQRPRFEILVGLWTFWNSRLCQITFSQMACRARFNQRLNRRQCRVWMLVSNAVLAHHSGDHWKLCT